MKRKEKRKKREKERRVRTGGKNNKSPGALSVRIIDVDCTRKSSVKLSSELLTLACVAVVKKVFAAAAVYERSLDSGARKQARTFHFWGRTSVDGVSFSPPTRQPLVSLSVAKLFEASF